MNKLEKYYAGLRNNKKSFDKLINKIEKSQKIEDKLFYAETALIYATDNNAGFYTSSYLEKFFIDYGKSIDIDNYDVEYIPNSFLHVMTEGYEVGGHTRVVERWIKNAPNSQKHSVFFTRKNNRMHILEQNTEEKNGECIYNNSEDNITKTALKLRKTALNYQYVILHTHMDDPVATIAFGTENFKRPVLFYNHASHLFWIGKGVSDVVLDILKNDPLTKTYRNIQNPMWVGIPTVHRNFDKLDKIEVRKKLNIPLNAKVIISAGSRYKYDVSEKNEKNIADIVSKAMNENTYFYLIGPAQKDKQWKFVNKKYKNIIPLGYIDFHDGYLNYMAAADLYLDSYPAGGWTAMIDAISMGLPALSYNTLQLDYFNESNKMYYSEKEYLEEINKILNDEDYAKQLAKKQYELLQNMQSMEAWNNRLNELFTNIKQVHVVKDLSYETDNTEFCDYMVYNNFQLNKYFIKKNYYKTICNLFKYILFYILKNNTKAKKYLQRYYLVK